MARYSYIKFTAPTYQQMLLDLVETELSAHPAWEAVDVVNSPGGMPCRVYRCKGSVNTIGKDWYLLVMRLNANPNYTYWSIAEGYNPVTKKVIRPTPGTNNTLVAPAADGSYGDGAEYSIWAGATGSTMNSTDIGWYSFFTSTALSECWLVVANAGMWFWNSNGRAETYSLGSFHAGPVDRFVEGPDLIVCGDFSHSSFEMRSTRHPTVTYAVVDNWRWKNPTSPEALWTPYSGQVNGPCDRFWGGRPVAARRCVRTWKRDPSAVGDLYGLYPGVALISTFAQSSYSDSVPSGDTIQLPRTDGSGLSDTFAYAFRAASGPQGLWVDISQP